MKLCSQIFLSFVVTGRTSVAVAHEFTGTHRDLLDPYQMQQDPVNPLVLNPNEGSPFYFQMNTAIITGLSVPSDFSVDYYSGGCKSQGGTLYTPNEMGNVSTLFEYVQTVFLGETADANGVLNNVYYIETNFTPDTPDIEPFSDGFGNTNVCLDIRCSGNIPCGISLPFSILVQRDQVDGAFTVSGITTAATVVAETQLTFGNGAVAVASANLCNGQTTVSLGENLCLDITHDGLPHYSIDFFDSFYFSQLDDVFNVILPGGTSAPTTIGPNCAVDGTTQTCRIETPMPFVSGEVNCTGEVVFIDNANGDGIPDIVNRRRLAAGESESGKATMEFSFQIVDQDTSAATMTTVHTMLALGAGLVVLAFHVTEVL